MFRGIKGNENWRKRYNKEVMQLFGDLDILYFVRIIRLNWIGRISGMNCKTKVIQVFGNNPRGSRPRGLPNNRRWNCVQRDTNECNIKNWKRVKIKRAGSSPLRR
jgi:hypothetical protein